jgi:hypothetical protein
VLDEEPTRPSALTPPEGPAGRPAGLAGHAQRLQGDLDNILLKALEKRPRRYASVDELAADLRATPGRLPGERARTEPGLPAGQVRAAQLADAAPELALCAVPRPRAAGAVGALAQHRPQRGRHRTDPPSHRAAGGGAALRAGRSARPRRPGGRARQHHSEPGPDPELGRPGAGGPADAGQGRAGVPRAAGRHRHAPRVRPPRGAGGDQVRGLPAPPARHRHGLARADPAAPGPRRRGRAGTRIGPAFAARQRRSRAAEPGLARRPAAGVAHPGAGAAAPRRGRRRPRGLRPGLGRERAAWPGRRAPRANGR